jgi:hypothetical protein
MDMGVVGGAVCGETTCGPTELCLQVPGCPIGPNPDPKCVPAPSDYDPGGGCEGMAEDPCGGGCTNCIGIVDGVISCDCQCDCASPDTSIATPRGERDIADLKVGDLVYSVEADAVVVAPIVAVSRKPTTRHRVMRVALEGGSVLEISPGHPTADGRLFADLRAGGSLDGARILNAELIPYRHAFTHDILPETSTGAYFAEGRLIGSTLAPTAPGMPVACR